MAPKSPTSRRSPVTEDAGPNIWVLPIQPPVDETEAQRIARVTKQLAAKAVSDHIDAEIAREKREIKKQVR